jgi:hypothetical protein
MSAVAGCQDFVGSAGLVAGSLTGTAGATGSETGTLLMRMSFLKNLNENETLLLANGRKTKHKACKNI